ncbi:virulence factor MVIN family protein [Candidatus Moduliflexus flocculans]|uniref:Virulence factor MVIN family protein n=1 Tax=Candidatus Moduliflexus flocculans TaxID=1499966 RepID=A0A081BNF0_9BACT|nr:virulence factor MVIN family protein [Candidatus Moduliflexus flocculans]
MIQLVLHRFSSLVFKKIHSSQMAQIQRATLTLMTGLLLENGISFFKSLLIARYYGTSGEFDAYVLSLTPYLFLFGMISGAIHAAMIPRYLKWQETFEIETAVDRLASFTIWLLGVLVCISVALWTGSKFISISLGQGFTPSQLALTTSLLKISIGLFVLSVLINLGIALLQAHHRFFFSALVPVVGGIISLGYLLLFRQQGIFSLLWGMITAAFVEIALIAFGLRSLFPKRWPRLALLNIEFLSIGRTMTPLLLSASFGHLNVAIDQMMASTLPTGSIASLHYAIRLHNLSTQMFIMMTSSAVFPFFAKQVAAGEFAALKKTFLLTIARLLFILFPVVLIIIFGGEWLVKQTFERGAFSGESTVATANAWIAYSIGLPIQAVGILTARIYNALQRNTILTWVSGISIGVNILLNRIFMSYWGHVGIAMSTSAVYTMVTIALVYHLYRHLWNTATAGSRN